MSKMNDVDALIQACLEEDFQYIDIVEEVRKEMGEGLMSAAIITNNYMRKAQMQNKHPAAIAYNSPVYRKYTGQS